MENKLNNKQKFWLSFTTILMIGFFSIILVIGLSWVNTPTDYNFTFDIDTDNQTKEAIMYLADIKEHQVRENNLFCENELLNLSKNKDLEIMQLQRWFEVEQFRTE